MKKIGLFLGVLGLSVSLIACGGTSGEVEARSLKEFEKISVEGITSGSDITIVRHKETGCNYLIYQGVRKGGLTQMMIEKDGVSVPYCESK